VLQNRLVVITDFFFEILNYMLEQCDFGGRFKYVNSTTLKSEFQLVLCYQID